MESGCKWLHQKLLQHLVAMALCCQGVAMGTVWSLVMRSHPDEPSCVKWQKKLVITVCYGCICCSLRGQRSPVPEKPDICVDLNT